MSGIIKVQDARAADVRALSLASASLGPSTPPEPVVDPELAALRLEASSLAQQLKQRDAEIEQFKRDVDAAFLDGEAQGRKAGLAEADDRVAESLAKLEGGVFQATAIFAEKMSCLEQLAVLLAHESLGRILEDPAVYDDLLSSTIRTHLDRLEQQAVICVEVSRADFPEAARLARLTSAVARPDLDIHACDELAAGGCRIKLRLGTLEIGIAQQWSRLGEALRSLTEPEEAE
jgi:flagellar biosynthesis/type III secretory pathway protein FliH